MKPIKTLGFVVAALMVTALAGAPSAMAGSTSLCDQDSECGGGHIITHVHVTTASGKQATLLSSIINVSCDVLFLGETISELGAPLELSGNLTYSNCNNSCTVTEESESVFVEVLRVGHETANVGGEAEVKVHCGFFINCIYNGEGEGGLAVAKGPLLSSATNGEVSLNEATISRVSGFCPEIALLDITVIPLSKIYITT